MQLYKFIKFIGIFGNYILYSKFMYGKASHMRDFPHSEMPYFGCEENVVKTHHCAISVLPLELPIICIWISGDVPADTSQQYSAEQEQRLFWIFLTPLLRLPLNYIGVSSYLDT